MYKTEFYVAGCPHCRQFKKSALIFNFTAPIGDKMDFVEIHSGENRLAVLEKLYPGDMLSLPTATMDTTFRLKQFGQVKEKTVRVALLSTSTTNYTLNILRMLNGEQLNLY